MLMPQEVEVWYVLPALRKELARIMTVELNLSQKETAGLLGVTESAISQYKAAKRAKAVVFDGSTVIKVRAAAKRIIKDRKLLRKELIHLGRELHKSGALCKIHHSIEQVPEACSCCK